jgi:hypothetical protein
MATNNNQPSTWVHWLDNVNHTQQADDEDLVGRVGEFVAFETAVGGSSSGGGWHHGSWCTMVWVWVLCLLPKQMKTGSDNIPLVGILRRVLGREIESLHPSALHFGANSLGGDKKLWTILVVGLGRVVIGTRARISLGPPNHRPKNVY